MDLSSSARAPRFFLRLSNFWMPYDLASLSILKELRRLPPSSMCTLWTSLLNLSIPDVPFPVLLSTLIRSRFQAKPATSWSPLIFPFLFAMEELYGTRYHSGSFSLLINVGSGFHCLRSFSFYQPAAVRTNHWGLERAWQFDTTWDSPF